MALENDSHRWPKSKDYGDDKYVDFKVMESVKPMTPEDLRKAQLHIAVAGRKAGLPNTVIKKLLEELGIGERIELDDDRKDGE